MVLRRAARRHVCRQGGYVMEPVRLWGILSPLSALQAPHPPRRQPVPRRRDPRDRVAGPRTARRQRPASDGIPVAHEQLRGAPRRTRRSRPSTSRCPTTCTLSGSEAAAARRQARALRETVRDGCARNPPRRPCAHAEGQGVRVMEAFLSHFHPQWRRVREMVRAGEIGPCARPRALRLHAHGPANIRNILGAGGGAIPDIGCYAVSSARFLLGQGARARGRA